MRERISRLSRGFVEYGNCTIRFSEREIQETVTEGRKERGEFRIYNDENVLMKGLVYSSDRRVKLKSDQFAGTGCLLSYEVDGTRDAAGTLIGGEFQIISNFGEYTIPYTFRVKAGDDVLDRLQTAESFAEFARKNRDTALKLFDSAAFVRLPFMRAPSLRALYDGLTARGNKRIAMEEFLTGSGLKEHIRLLVEDREHRFLAENLPEEDNLCITRSTWGYVRVEVESKAPFLILEKKAVSEEDFEENVCRFRFRYDKSAVHSGINSGSLIFRTIYQTFEVPFTIEGPRKVGSRDLRVRQEWIDYQKNYLEYASGKGDDSTLLRAMDQSMSYIRENTAPDDLKELLHAEIYLLQERREETGLLLADVKNRLSNETTTDVLAYYLFLHAMYAGTEIEKREMLARLNRLSENPLTATDSVMLLLFRVDAALQENPSLELTQIKTQFRRGCRNPLLYLEACRILNNHPELLRVLDNFELQVLFFGVREELVGSRLARMCAQLASQERAFRPLFFTILKKLYERYQDTEILSGICALLMRGDCRNEKYFPWYAKGVEKDIRLTRLYEYYLYSLPYGFTGEIPRMVLLYFSYNNTLDFVTQARLYAYVLDHSRGDLQVQEAYRRPMEEFVREQMIEGHINGDLAKLYERILSPDLIDTKMGRSLPRLLYAYQLSCENPQVRYLIVRHGELRDETVLPLKNGQTFVSLYLDDTQILAQDTYGNRYEGVYVTSARLLDDPALEKKCREAAPDHWLLALRDAVRGMEAKNDGGRWVRRVENIRSRTELHPLFRELMMAEILHYFEENPDEDRAVDFILSIRPEMVAPEDRMKIIELLTEKEYFREAYDIAVRFGYEGVKPSRLLRLCNRMILEKNMERDENLLDMAYTCFKQKRVDAVVIQYLCRYYNGGSRDMYQMLINGREVNATTYDLEDRLLGQMLFSGCRENLDETFRIYAERPSGDEAMVRGYLVVKSYRSFLEKEPLSDELATYMKGLLRSKKNFSYLPAVCLMALTWSDSRKSPGTLSAEDCDLCGQMIEALYRKGYVFAYYQNCARFTRLPDELSDKVIVEYRAKKNDRIRIRIRISPGDEETPVRTMPHMYEGIFVLPIAVFYGETLQYEIIDMGRDGEVVEKREVAVSKEERFGQKSRIAMLNQILSDLETEKTDELRDALLDYGAMDEMVKELFTPV